MVWIDDDSSGADAPDAADGPEAAVSRRQLGRRIASALDGLPPDQREAVWLVDGQGFKFAEAARILGVPPGTVASRVAPSTNNRAPIVRAVSPTRIKPTQSHRPGPCVRKA